MNFKQDELISSGYIFYTLGVTITLLIVVYFILFFLKRRIGSKLFQQVNNEYEYKTIKLSSKATLYILDRKDYDLVVVESSQNVSITHVPKYNSSNLLNNRQSSNEL